MEAHPCQPSWVLPVSCEKFNVSKSRDCCWDMAENSQKKNWRGSHHDNNIIKLVWHNSSGLKGAMGTEVCSMRIKCRAVTRGRAGNFLAAQFLRLLTTHTGQLEILVKTPGSGIFLWLGVRFDVNLYLKKEGRMERGVSLMTLNHKKNAKDFNERKIIAQSWLI